MKTFHSSGTPSGSELMMKRWKPIMAAAAAVVSAPPVENSSTAGTTNSNTVPPWASAAERRDGVRSSGWDRKNRRLSALLRSSGLLDSITDTTNGKWALSLEVAAPHQIATITSLSATIMSTPPNRKATHMTR